MAQKISRTKIYIAAAVLIAVFLPSFAKYQELRYKNKKLDEEIVSLQKESKRLEEEKRKLETDITYIEKKAREKMGVVRKGEIVLKETPKKK